MSIKRTSTKLILAILALVVVGAAVAYLLAPQSDSLSEYKPAARFVEPDGYYSSKRLKKWYMNPETAQGKVLMPRRENIGEFKDRLEGKPFVRHDGFLGPEGCRECHAETVDSFMETAHFQTSRLPDPNSLMGEFEDGKNRLPTGVPGMNYSMLKSDNGYSQQVSLEREGKTYHHEKQVDIVTGSGNHALTYLYWIEERLYQLPITWSTIGGGEWVNSPGYNDGFADFARPINAQCMSCHATRFEVRETTANEFDKDSYILGVTCERCHGPGKQHADYHRENPKAKESKFIVHPADLPRDRMNDICGQCHNGNSKPLKPSFSFRPGDRLTDFNQFPAATEAGTGVHSTNQQARLLKSRCFQEDDTMNCRTCHNPHRNEHGDVKLFSNRCQKCHQPKDCGQFETSGARIADNCIDCHMPKEQDDAMGMTMGKKQIFPVIRDHNIRIHSDATAATLKRWLSEDANEQSADATNSELKSNKAN